MSEEKFNDAALPKRRRGRPSGASNKIKIDDALKHADRASVKAIKFLEDLMEGNIQGATAQQGLTAATKILDIAVKHKEQLEQAALDRDAKTRAENTEKPVAQEKKAPLISSQPIH